MTLKATITTRIGRIASINRDDDSPLPEGTNTLPQPLHVEGTPDEPDVFSLSDRVTLHAPDPDGGDVGRRYAALERELAAVYHGIERLDAESNDDSGDTSLGDSSNPSENEA
jgi:hypothetical protein